MIFDRNYLYKIRYMNTGVIVKSLKYVNYFKLVHNLSIWIYEELKLINYSDAKLVISFEKRDYEVTKDIISLVNDTELLSKFNKRNYIKGYELIVTELFLMINCYREELLISASYSGYTEIVKLLIDNGVNIHTCDDYALRWSSEKGHVEIVKLLLDNGADIHAYGDYALKWASCYGHVEVVRLLLEYGADIHTCNNYALRWARENGHTKIVKLLIENDANVYTENKYALRSARENGHTKIVELLSSINK